VAGRDEPRDRQLRLCEARGRIARVAYRVHSARRELVVASLQVGARAEPGQEHPRCLQALDRIPASTRLPQAAAVSDPEPCHPVRGRESGRELPRLLECHIGATAIAHGRRQAAA
jgi:hypothetical protein